MQDVPQDDPRQAILRELEAMAHRDPAHQAAWLDGIRDKYRDHPHRDQIVGKFQTALLAMKQMHEAQVGLARAEELLEADSVAKIDAILSGALRLPEPGPERTRLLLFVTLAGHFLPNVRARLEREDAQQFLRAQFAELFSQATPGG